jgi:predicted ATPase
MPDPLGLSRELFTATGGHPLFVTELVAGLQDAGLLYRDSGGLWQAAASDGIKGLAPTATLRDAVLERANRLEAGERDMLDAAAVLGSASSVERMAETLRVDTASV